MPPPRIIGQSATPGLLDVETADGSTRAIPAWMAPRLGLSADLAAGDVAVQQMQPPEAPMLAQAPTVDIGDVRMMSDAAPAPTVQIGDVRMMPAEPPAPARQSASEAMTQAQYRGAQDVFRGALDAVTGGAASTVTRALGGALADAQRGTEAAQARQAAAQEAAAPEAEATGAEVAQRAQQSRAQLAALEQAAINGDAQAVYQLFRSAQTGDVDAAQALDRARAFQGTGRGTGGGGPRVTRTETTRLQQQARPTTPEEAAALRQAAEEQDRAEREAMVATAQAVEAEAGALDETARAMQSAQSRADALERRRQQAEQARQAELMRRQRELDAAASQVASRQLDPGRLFAKGETRNRVAAAVGIVLGGLADAIRGGDAGLGSAMALVNSAIDRDIEAQRGNVAIAQQGVAAQQSLLQDMRRTFGDQQAAEEATRATMLEGVERQIQALALQATSDAQRAQLAQMLAEIQAQKAAARQAAIMGGIPMTEVVIEQRQRAGGGGAGRRLEIPATPEPAAAGERQSVAEAQAAAQADIDDAEQALALLDRTIQVGRIAGSALGSDGVLSSLRSEDARALDETLGRLARTPTAEAFGAANPEQMNMIQQQEGLTRDRSPEALRRAIERRAALARRRLEAARLGASTGAVREVTQRQPQEREAVTRQSGSLGTEIPGARRAP
jgi:hypothetical protein